MGPLLYKPPPRWQIYAALGGAIAIHAVAAVIAGIHSEPPVADLEAIPEATIEASIEQAPPEPEPTPPPEEPEPVEAPPEPVTPPEFVEEQPTPPPKPRTEKPKPVAPIARPKPAGVPGTVSMSNAKTAAISSPRPEYPYEARRTHATGSGVCVMTIDTSTGAVTNAEMVVSTGNASLDNSAISAFRRWRFRPGGFAKVRTPITFTLTGAQY